MCAIILPISSSCVVVVYCLFVCLFIVCLFGRKWLSGEEHNDGEECGGISGDIVGDEEDEQEGEELKQLSQFHVDRFAILLDLWTSEARYLQTKIKVKG